MSRPLCVTSLGEAQWRALGAQWDHLLGQSGADKLFLSSDWISLWWKHFGSSPDEQFTCIVVCDGALMIGAAPMIISEVKRRPGLRLRSAQCVGFRLHDSRGMLSEYLDAVAAPGREAEVRDAVLRHLIEVERCQEVSFGWSRSAPEWAVSAEQQPRTGARLMDPVTTYQADLSGGFEHYLGTLGGSTRRSLYNLRRRLHEAGPVRLKIAAGNETTEALNELNVLHAMRWGEPAFSGDRLAFHRALLRKWQSMNRIVLSRLYVADQCVSAMYDLRAGSCQYNLQMGFNQKTLPRVSLGLLHIGYAMEDAAKNGIQRYDFLGGHGMTTDYKRNLASIRQDLHTVQIFHGILPVTAFALLDGIRHCARGLRKVAAGTRY